MRIEFKSAILTSSVTKITRIMYLLVLIEVIVRFSGVAIIRQSKVGLRDLRARGRPLDYSSSGAS